ncbi:MAG: CHAT domain-containing protein [Leptolyngbyaceae cyanobacterium SL_7_1]|nr:CHAT domain-containing protein [Leptolyngbyaceae cyanobacterium SL_7_1]
MNKQWRRSIRVLLGLVLAIALSSSTEAAIPSTTVETAVSRAVAEIDSRITAIEQTWQQQYETHLGTRSGNTPLSATQINNTLAQLGNQTGKHLALIYVFPQPEALELVLVIPGAEPVRRIIPEAPQAIVTTVLNEFQSHITRAIITQAYLPAATQLYQWIVAPLEPALEAHQIDTLIFCVGEGVRSAPLAALYDGHQFLVENYSLGVIPAFSLTNSEYRGIKSAQVLAMGASQFQELSDLPSVPAELSAIIQNQWQGNIFLNQEFTLENLRQQLASKGFGIVHLATHAEFQPGSPTQSYIQLWQSDRLTLDQLQQLNWSELPVELLVLSACRTALGDRQAELGFAGLSFQAGVKSSLASLWYVSDVGTLALMREFYWQLSRPDVTTKAEALQRTQQAMLSGQVYIEKGQLYNSHGQLPLPSELGQIERLDFSSPYYWAAFTLVGSPW